MPSPLVATCPPTSTKATRAVAKRFRTGLQIRPVEFDSLHPLATWEKPKRVKKLGTPPSPATRAALRRGTTRMLLSKRIEFGAGAR